LSHADMIAIAEEDAQESISGTDPKVYSNTSNKTLSANREIRINQEELNQGGFSRSGRAAGPGGNRDAAPMAIRSGNATNTTGKNADSQRSMLPSNTNTSSPLGETRGAELAKGAEKQKSGRKKHEKGERPPQPLPGFLVTNHLKPISMYFCDRA